MKITPETPSSEWLYRKVTVNGRDAVVVSAAFSYGKLQYVTVEYSERADELGVDTAEIANNEFGIVHEDVDPKRIEWTTDYIDEDTILHSERGEKIRDELSKPKPVTAKGKKTKAVAFSAVDFPRHKVRDAKP